MFEKQVKFIGNFLKNYNQFHWVMLACEAKMPPFEMMTDYFVSLESLCCALRTLHQPHNSEFVYFSMRNIPVPH